MRRAAAIALLSLFSVVAVACAVVQPAATPGPVKAKAACSSAMKARPVVGPSGIVIPWYCL